MRFFCLCRNFCRANNDFFFSLTFLMVWGAKSPNIQHFNINIYSLCNKLKSWNFMRLCFLMRCFRWWGLFFNLNLQYASNTLIWLTGPKVRLQSEFDVWDRSGNIFWSSNFRQIQYVMSPYWKIIFRWISWLNRVLQPLTHFLYMTSIFTCQKHQNLCIIKYKKLTKLKPIFLKKTA